jgi:hypothetical protein
MDRNQELREKVLSYVKDFYESEERAPTIRMISENIEGITRSSFYKYFNGIGELCEEAGIDIPNNRLKRTKKASSTRKRKSESPFPDIILSDELARDLWVDSSLEKRDPQDLIKEFLEQYRLLKTEYGLDSKTLGSFARFIKDCELVGLNKDQIMKSMSKFIGMGLQNFSPKNFNMLMYICNFMNEKELDMGQLLVLFTQKDTLYKSGYELCVQYAENEVVNVLLEKGKMNRIDSVLIALKVKMGLQLKTPTRIPREKIYDYHFEPSM